MSINPAKTVSAPGEMNVTRFLREARQASPLLFFTAIAMLGLFVVCSLLPLWDGRLLNGESIWLKPAKFFLSLALHSLTLAWAASLLTTAERSSRMVRWAIAATFVAAWGEQLIITSRAAQGIASHFNNDTALSAALYAIMGVGALTLTGAAAVLGVALWRGRAQSLMREAAGIGFIAGAAMATLTAGYMSQRLGHSVGGLADDVGLPFFHWSTTGGDLRVAHFVGLHAMQIIPLAALSDRRSVVWLAALLVLLVTLGTFVQALSGIPLFRV